MRLTGGASAALIWALFTVEAPAQSLVAIVEDIHGGPAGLEFMDYVETGKQIQLGSNGRMVLSYLKSCFRETIVGGKVTVGNGYSQVSGGRVDRTQVPAADHRDLHTPPLTDDSFAQPTHRPPGWVRTPSRRWSRTLLAPLPSYAPCA